VRFEKGGGRGNGLAGEKRRGAGIKASATGKREERKEEEEKKAA